MHYIGRCGNPQTRPAVCEALFAFFIFLKFISLIYINRVIVFWQFDIFTTESYLFSLINVYYILFIYTN